MTTFWLVCASSGEYSDRSEWRVALYESEDRARAVAEGAKEIARANQFEEDAWMRRARRFGATRTVFGFDPPPPTPSLPPKPTPRPNPFDPENGFGDEYWVEKVEVRE